MRVLAITLARGFSLRRCRHHRVRYRYFYNLVWANIDDIDIEPGKSASRSTDQINDNSGAADQKQDVRWRLSRAVLTKAIDWELTYTVTRLSDESNATSERHATITSEK